MRFLRPSCLLPTLLLCTGLGPLGAQTLLTLTGSNVIGGSPVFFNSVYNASSYAAGNIFNQQSGPVDMSVQAGFAWFPYEGMGITNRYITIDLGASYVLTGIDVFNSNQSDRGTGSFSLSASNAITTGSLDGGLATGSAISGPTTLIASQALTFSTANPVTAQTFVITDTNTYRYLQLTAIDVPGSGGPFSAPGLAEVRLYGSAVPEPSTYALVAGAAAIGLAMWRGRRVTV